MKHRHDYSEAATIGAVLAFFLMWLAIPVALIVPFIVHIVVCVKANWVAMLIVGLVFPPVGWVHGVGIIFGVWG